MWNVRNTIHIKDKDNWNIYDVMKDHGYQPSKFKLYVMLKCTKVSDIQYINDSIMILYVFINILDLHVLNLLMRERGNSSFIVNYNIMYLMI